MGCWRTKASYFKDALKKTEDISELQKVIIEERYVRLLESYERRCIRLSLIFHTARILITVGSLVVPALLSIQYTNTGSSNPYPDADSLSYRIYWTTWVLSLLVTTSNGVVNVFKLDKKYYFIHTTYQHLRSEGWQYIGLTGRYSILANSTATHSNQFIYFCHMIEKIKMKQVEEEYYKLSEIHESAKHPQTQTQTQAPDSLLPMSPLKPIGEMVKSLPPELRSQLVGLGFKSSDSVENGPSTPIEETTVSVSTDLSGNTIKE
jgi:hypothetical protein